MSLPTEDDVWAAVFFVSVVVLSMISIVASIGYALGLVQ